VLIVDTGSTDNTINKTNEWLVENKIKGIVLQESWRDFSYNRSHALAEIRKIEKIEYVLMIDADEILKFDQDIDFESIKKNLTKDIHSIECRHGNISYLRNSVTRNNKSFCYKGIVHEFLHCNEPVVFGEVIKGIQNIPLQDSFRNKSSDKYKKDALLLEEAIKKEKDTSLISRYCFYLAQSYRDLGEKEKAMYWYNERIKFELNEEAYYSFYQIAKIKEFLGFSEDDVIQSYMKAHEVYPERIEAIFGAVMFCRKNHRYHQAYILAKHSKSIKIKQDGLFVENWIYDYGIDDELGVICYWIGNYNEGVEISENLINKIPIDQKPRILKNLELLWKKSN
jgi:tetratricopeptide (TPR) repeat protein